MSEVIRFEEVSKRFVLERDRPQSFKEAFVGTMMRRSREPNETLMALDGVSFELERGGSLGFVGPNGTGKSTSLKLIARILEPTAGRVLVNGRVAALLELGAGFHPDLTGRENVYLNGSMMGFGRKEMDRRLSKIIDFSELGRFIEMPVKHYSSGMYMRLGFSTAIHLDADILLIDEVLAVGDQAFQNKCRDRIFALKRSGVSIVLVSHDNNAIRDLCSRTIWLEDGKLKGYGETDQVIEAYYASMVVREETRLAAERIAAGETDADKEGDDAQEEEPDRWGSGEVRIERVEFLDAEGGQHDILHTGRPLTVRIHYHASERVERPVFGLGIHRVDGLHINGPNTLDAGLSIDAVEGRGTVDWQIDNLALMSGSFELSASCYDHSCSHPYDHRNRHFPFKVRAGALNEQYGLVHMPARWVHQPSAIHAADQGPPQASPAGEVSGDGSTNPGPKLDDAEPGDEG
jgi:lipopolysaccharide transport system ATP-binding protein